jgi:F-type H+-transporting ATPase subunit gamma
MQMIATAKFQKSLKRAIGTKPFTLKVRELVRELAASVGDVEHPLLRRPGPEEQSNRIALMVITSNRGLAGAYNGSILRLSNHFIRDQIAAGKTIELYVVGKKGISFFNFQKRPIARRLEAQDMPRFADVERVAQHFIDEFIAGKVDSVHIAYMNFISAGQQKAEVTTLLPLAGVAEAPATSVKHEPTLHAETMYDFMPSAKELLDELLPQTVKAATFQAFIDSTTSEHVSRMIAMKSATDNADKIQKALTMQYNRARQSQITTELSEIMGGVEAMKG